ncbi:putative signal peptide protein [Puccinia sorghi]|uniref:Putative signal peptide protein n=1 Tax=Puccinia sorghi TaxID=27349 RepID=A0A0L6VDA9_9BASI|nr:putative signal peptide protein [Puccinia sorghi]
MKLVVLFIHLFKISIVVSGFLCQLSEHLLIQNICSSSQKTFKSKSPKFYKLNWMDTAASEHQVRNWMWTMPHRKLDVNAHILYSFVPSLFPIILPSIFPLQQHSQNLIAFLSPFKQFVDVEPKNPDLFPATQVLKQWRKTEFLEALDWEEKFPNCLQLTIKIKA